MLMVSDIKDLVLNADSRLSFAAHICHTVVNLIFIFYFTSCARAYTSETVARIRDMRVVALPCYTKIAQTGRAQRRFTKSLPGSALLT